MLTTIKSVSEVKSSMPRILSELKATHEPILIVSNGHPEAVLQDVHSYEHTHNAIALLKMMIQSEKSVTRQHGSPTTDVISRLRNRVNGRTE